MICDREGSGGPDSVSPLEAACRSNAGTWTQRGFEQLQLASNLGRPKEVEMMRTETSLIRSFPRTPPWRSPDSVFSRETSICPESSKCKAESTAFGPKARSISAMLYVNLGLGVGGVDHARLLSIVPGEEIVATEWDSCRGGVGLPGPTEG